jgi:site-specific DNA recombinase
MTAASVLDDQLREKRCAIYTRKSTDEGLDSEFNSLDAQRASCAAFIASQRHEKWVELSEPYDDGGYSGGSLDRPAFQRLLADVRDGKIDVIVVYKVDRLTRSLLDFARIVGVLEASGASFVSITQAFNSTTSMGRLTLNVLLSFAQFEREIASERVRDKIAASKAKGIWMGGTVPLGYDVVDRRLVLNESEAATVRHIFKRYLDDVSGPSLVRELAKMGLRSKARWRNGEKRGDGLIMLGALYAILKNPLYMGKIAHAGARYDARHDAIVDEATFDRVQGKLEQNRIARRFRAGAAEASPLAGLLTDSYNRPMTPSHTQRRGRRYRYYVSQDRAGQESRETWRVNASEMERLALDCLVGAVERAMADYLAESTAEPDTLLRMQTVARKTVDRLRGWPSTESQAMVRAALANVFVGQSAIVVCGSLKALNLAPFAAQEFRVSAATRGVRRGGTLKLMIPPPDTTAPADAPFIRLIAQAVAIRRRLESGETIDNVARVFDLHPDYVIDLTRVSLLAPSLLTTLIQGTQPDCLSRKMLMDASRIPLHWHLQRERFQLLSGGM